MRYLRNDIYCAVIIVLACPLWLVHELWRGSNHFKTQLDGYLTILIFSLKEDATHLYRKIYEKSIFSANTITSGTKGPYNRDNTIRVINFQKCTASFAAGVSNSKWRKLQDHIQEG